LLGAVPLSGWFTAPIMKTFTPTTCAVLLGATGLASGAGYYLPNQDALATAKGNAFVATADSAAAVHYNPAGLTQLERPEGQVGFYGITLGNEATVGGVGYQNEEEYQVAPHLFFGAPVNDDLAWGFGINSPYGLGNDWGQGTPFRTVITEARLAYLATTGAIAYAVTDEFSIGASLSLNYLDLALEQGVGFFPGDYLRFEGTACRSRRACRRAGSRTSSMPSAWWWRPRPLRR
jgi:long-chain fatty acid transport protein